MAAPNQHSFWPLAEHAGEALRLRQIVDGALPGAQILRVAPLGADRATADETKKAGGYGVPLRIDVMFANHVRRLVLHTASNNEFGHDRRADRAEEMVLAADTFGSIPNHARVLDVGAYRNDGGFVSLAETGEFYLLTTFAEGAPYAEDLRRIARVGRATPRDTARVRHLAEYLGELHASKIDGSPAVYARSIRDTIGSGEGVFGIADSYPEAPRAIAPARLERIEEQCLAWRFRIKRRAERLARIHGDFHPFNVLFDDHSNLSVLDTSRGSLGDPADDVTSMSLNYPFFALGHSGAWRGALRAFWYEFWRRYVALTRDEGVLEVAAPFFAWRGLVLGNPKWYPDLAPNDRERIFAFIEKVLELDRFSPALAEEFFDS